MRTLSDKAIPPCWASVSLGHETYFQKLSEEKFYCGITFAENEFSCCLFERGVKNTCITTYKHLLSWHLLCFPNNYMFA